MARSKSEVDLVKKLKKQKTAKRTYRFDAVLLESFEGDCARHGSNPRQVVEALIRQWLDADELQRAAIAERHLRWAGLAYPLHKQGSRPGDGSAGVAADTDLA